MTTQTLPASATWIVSTSLDKPDQETRRFIRSHVMRGKNTRASRRSRKVAAANKAAGRHTPEEDRNWVVTTPRRVASDLSLLGLETDIKPHMLDVIHRAFTFMKSSQYSVEITLLGRKDQDFFCFSDLARSPVMVHAMLFTTQAFLDGMRGRTPSATYGQNTRYHLSETLRRLQETLNNGKTALETPTMLAVCSLATAGLFLGDVESAALHMDGLYKMVNLAGGLDALGRGTILEHKVQRLDFGLSLRDGRKVRFFRDDMNWGPHPTLSSGSRASRFTELSAVQPSPDPRLLIIWADMRGFSAAANQATALGMRMPASLFADITSSTPYRLTHLDGLEPASLPELLRLSMMAMLKCILTSVRGLGRHMNFLSAGLKAALLSQQAGHGDAWAPELGELLVWALFMAALAVFEDFDRDWIREMLQSEVAVLGLRSWSDTRAVLKKFLWVDFVFDGPAEQLYNDWLG